MHLVLTSRFSRNPLSLKRWPIQQVFVPNSAVTHSVIKNRIKTFRQMNNKVVNYLVILILAFSPLLTLVVTISICEIRVCYIEPTALEKRKTK